MSRLFPIFTPVLFMATLLGFAARPVAATVMPQYEGLWINQSSRECSLVMVSGFNTVRGQPGFEEFKYKLVRSNVNGPWINSYETPYGTCVLSPDLATESCCGKLKLTLVSQSKAVRVSPLPENPPVSQAELVIPALVTALAAVIFLFVVKRKVFNRHA